MSNTDEMRKLNQEGSKATEMAKEDGQVKVEHTKSKERKLTEGDVDQIKNERQELESLYNIRMAMKSKKSLIELAQKREAFFEKYHLALDDFVIFGKYMLAQDGTVKRIEVKEKLLGKFPDLIPMQDFKRSVTSFTTEEIEDISAEFSN